jgi:hypothetical protein
MTANVPFYKRRPIGSIEALARALGSSPDTLRALADQADGQYRVAKRIRKPNGSERVVYEAREPLKSLQRRILEVMRDVDYPAYLMGGIPTGSCIRGYIENADQHAGSTVLIQEDISNFFPNVTIGQVRRVFLHVFRFPPGVSNLMAKLCTRQGALTQGASPSTYLANLILFSSEPIVEKALRNRGLLYSRFVDDINVSATIPMPTDVVQLAVDDARALVERAGFKLNRTKQGIAGRGTHRTIHGLNVTSSRATLSNAERRNIRASVRQLEHRVAEGGDTDTFYKDWQRAMGRVGRLQAIHPAAGRQLKVRLRLVRASVILQESRSFPP